MVKNRTLSDFQLYWIINLQIRMLADTKGDFTKVWVLNLFSHQDSENCIFNYQLIKADVTQNNF